MADEIIYMALVLVAGFAVNFGLRALPFALFGGRRKDAPAWTARFGEFVSPVIIAGLVVYSMAGLEWRTPWPYAAGALVVAVQLWRGNPLASIVSGTVLYMCLLACGCVSERMVDLGAVTPSVCVKPQGVYFNGDPSSPEDVVDRFRRAGVVRDRVVHIMLDGDVRDMREARRLMYALAGAGYTRPVLVTKRHAEAAKADRDQKPRDGGGARQGRGRIRYKRADE